MSSTAAENKNNTLKLVGAASCSGAQDTRCDMGPTIIHSSNIISRLEQDGITADWEQNLHPHVHGSDAESIADLCAQVAKTVCNITDNQNRFAVIGGDHSCAIGTWSGAANALRNKALNTAAHHHGSLGLIWIDAHMDSHTPETSPSGAYHGMPLACLLGHGHQALLDIGYIGTKLQPEHVCLIGVRSYESAEASLLKQAGVRVFFMDEIRQRGLKAVINDALDIVDNTDGFGVSIDLDAIDPVDAPGVGSPTQGGIMAEQLLNELPQLKTRKNFIGTEITEFNPFRDVNDKTANLVVDLVCALA